MSRGLLVLPGGVTPGTLTFGTHIKAVTPEAVPNAEEHFILPGFIDTHVHGGAGGDTMDGPGGVRTLARFHARHGTTTILPTTITNPWDRVLAALSGVREVMEGGVPGGADVIGAHLEGPFISSGRLGAQPPNAVDPTPDLVAEVLAAGMVRAVTLAPELPGAVEAGLAFARADVRVGVGHTRADAETVTAFLDTLSGVAARTCATHLFNAMGGIEGRAPGPAGALLVDPHAFSEVILDGIHVHETSFRLACAAAPGRVLLITDAMRAAGLGDGESELGGRPVMVREGRATLGDGTIAGSLLTLDAALRNAVWAGLPLPEASAMLSGVPARSLDLTDRGHLEPGLRADLVVLDTDLNVVQVYVAGIPILEETS